MSLPLNGAARVPVVLRGRAVTRATKNRVAAYAAIADVLQGGRGFLVRALAEDQVVLERLRRRAQKEGRRCGVRVAAFAATPAGRRLHRVIDELSERIALREKQLLCG